MGRGSRFRRLWARREAGPPGGSRRRRLPLPLAVGLALLLLAPSSSSATANPHTQALLQDLRSLADVLGDLSGDDLLSDAIPLTDLDPVGDSGLGLADLLDDLLDVLPGDLDEADLQSDAGREALRAALEDVDDGGWVLGGVTVRVGCDGTAEGSGECAEEGEEPVTVTEVSGTDTFSLTDLVVPLHASRTVTLPLTLDTNVFAVDGGTTELALTFDTVLRLRFDPNQLATAPHLALSLNAQPSVPETGLDLPTATITAALTTTGFGLDTRLGITDVTVGVAHREDRSSLADVALSVTVQDPDGDGQITRDEWTATAIDDLTDVSRSGSAHPKVTLDTDLTATSPDVTWTPTVTLNDTPGFALPALDDGDLAGLAPFDNMTPEQLILALGQFAGGLDGAQQATDVALPFLKENLSRAVKVAGPLIDFVEQQSIICGTETSGGLPPTGDVSNLAAGTEVHCQAFSSVTPESGSITWTVGAGVPASPSANTSGADADGTIAPAPTAYATFEMDGDGSFDVSATYTVHDDRAGVDIPKQTRRPARTAQALVTKLGELAGFDVTDALAYDGTTQALTFRLAKTFPGDTVSFGYDFGDRLDFGTGLVGLSSDGVAGVTASVSDVEVDLTFGALLLPDASTVVHGGDYCIVPSEEGTCSASTPLDRFFVQVDPEEPEFSIGDGGFDATAPSLTGRLGFLEVTASGAATSECGDETFKTFCIGKRAGHEDDPVLAVDLVPAASVTVGGETLDDAILLRELLFRVAERADGSVNLAMHGAVQVSAALEDGTPLGTGTVAIDWDDVTAGPPRLTPDLSELTSFDLSPALYGTHSGDPSSTELTDAGGRAFPTEAVGVRVRNLTDGSFCEVGSVSGDSLTCADDLGGAEASQWNEGDRYKLEVGDPLALLWLLLDNLDAVVDRVDRLGDTGIGDVLEEDLPLVGVSPDDILGVLRGVKQATNDLRGGPGPSIDCGTHKSVDPETGETVVVSDPVGTVPATGDPSDLSEVPVDDDGQQRIYCSATNPKPASDITWTITGAGTSVESNGSGTDAEGTVGQPATKNAVFVVPDDARLATGPGDPGGYRVQVAFTDADGDHTVGLPASSVPPTLQRFEETLEDRLGIDPERLALAVEDVELDGATTGSRSLTVRLNYGVCSGVAGDDDFCDDFTADGSANADPIQTPFNADFGGEFGIGGGDLVGIGTDGNVEIGYGLLALFGLAVPLDPDDFAPRVLDDTGLTLKARASAADVDLKVNVGPISLRAGTGGKPGGDGLGELRVGVDFLVGQSGGSGGTAQSIGTFFSSTNLDAGFEAPSAADQSCGPIDKNEDGTIEDDETLTGVACAALSIGEGTGSVEHLGDVGVEVGLSGGTFTVDPYVPDDLADNFLDRILSWDMLLRALPAILEELESGLSAAAAGTDEVPVIGDALDAGADVVEVVNDDVVPLVEQVGAFIDDQIAAIAASDECQESDGTPTECLEENDCDDEETEDVTEECDPSEACLDDEDNATECPEPREANASDIEEAIENFLWDELGHDTGGAGLILSGDGFAAGEREDVHAETVCGGSPCGTAHYTEIDDVRVTLNIGQVVDTDLPFDVGLDGVPLRLAGGVAGTASWNLVVDLGLARDVGPYLVVDDQTSDPKRGAEELKVEAELGLGTAPDVCGSEIDDDLEVDAIGFDASDERCLTGKVGFLAANVRDGDGTSGTDQSTALELDTFLDLRKKSDPDGVADDLTTIALPDLVGGELLPVLGLTVDTRINLRFRTGIPSGQVAGFPSVIGTFHLDWAYAVAFGGDPDGGPRPLTIGFDELHLDIGEFLDSYLEPVLKEIRNITGPFKPVIETLNAPIPVVSDLAALVGQPPLTLLALMEAVSDNNLTVVKSLAAFIEFANSDKAASGLIALGGSSGSGFSSGAFDVDPTKARLPQSPGTAGSLVQTISGRSGGDLFGRNPSGGSSSLRSTYNKSVTATKDNLPGTFGVPGLTFPFMDDATRIFGLLMGQDITLIRYDVGTLRATAGFSYDFGPFFIGPVPVTAGVGGAVTLSGRFALGYDSSGIRKVLDGGSGVHLFDGIFIDDLDASGVDVPEVSLVGEVFARAGVTVVVATAGIEGGIRLTVDLNLDDSPEPDGKLRIEEVFNKLSNPICLFDVSGRLEAFLRAFLEIDYFLSSKRWDWEILSVVLLDFSAACSPPSPVLAVQDGGTLLLNMGSDARRNARQVAVGTVDEKFVVRPVGGGKYSVSAFGVYQVYGPGAPFGGPDPITKVVADGADGNDTILLEPGADENQAVVSDENPQLPFTAQAIVLGGADDDIIQGGDGDDALAGGSGNDKIKGGGGNDLIYGDGPTASGSGDDDDTLDGGAGHDVVLGGRGSDRIGGGPGADHLDGGDGDDFLAGGPGADPNALGLVEGTQDLADVLIGGGDDDQAEGGFGNDVLYGDESLDAHGSSGVPVPSGLVAAIGDLGTTRSGGGISVASPSGLLPTSGDVDAACEADGSSAGEDVLDGGEDDDHAFGGGGADEVVGGRGNDVLCGNGGDDDLDGDSADHETASGGDDTLDGGADHDVLRGRSGHDLLRGGDGNDLLDGGVGNDDLIGGQGRDVLDGAAGRDVAIGDEGDIGAAAGSGTSRDAIDRETRVGAVSSTGHTTDDTADLLTEEECVYDLDDRASRGDADGAADCIHGGTDDDVLFGGVGRDRITGGDGDDHVDGGDHGDHLRGGKHADWMYGRDGHDEMHGDSGADEMFGGDGDDLMRGGMDDDHMRGNDGADEMFGDGGHDRVIGGSDAEGEADANVDLGGDLGSIGDRIQGGAGDDTIAGDNGRITASGAVTLFDVATTDEPAPDGTSGDDRIQGGDGADRLFGQGGDDIAGGGSGDDRIEGNDGEDELHGGHGRDVVVGGTTAEATLVHAGAGDEDDRHADFGDALDVRDEIHGGPGDDMLLGDDVDVDAAGSTVFHPSVTDPGTFGDDEVHGDAGDDRIWGQYGGDELHGGDGHDHVLGDLGTFTASSDPVSTWPGGAPNYVVALVAPDVGGEDDVFGGDGHDHVYGGAGNDTIEGGHGDDHLEGNGGADVIHGLGPASASAASAAAAVFSQDVDVPDQDDIIGGSSSVQPEATSTGALDDGDHLVGDGGHDVIIGDNGEITRTLADGDDGSWASDTITGGWARDVELYDRHRTEDETAPHRDLSQVSGGDTIFGDAGNDRLYGQGDDDHLRGGANDDYVEGNQGSDWAEGNAGNDDLIGGSSTESSPGVGEFDAGDHLHGGAGQDVIVGDNAKIVRDDEVVDPSDVYFTTDGRFLGSDQHRWIVLRDLGTLDGARHGEDVISAGADDDIAFGQDGDDWVSGGSDTDYAEGNGGADVLVGDALLDDDLDGRAMVVEYGNVPDVPQSLVDLQADLTSEFGVDPSDDTERDGTQGPAGQDDLIGGSSISAHRDGGDLIYGDGSDDFVLGDNGELIRYIDAGSYDTYTEARNGARIARDARRFDVGAAEGDGVWGADHVEGGDGDDAVWGQDGRDEIWGQDGDDDLFGELGADAVYGGAGEDALIGDRGGVVNTLITEEIAGNEGHPLGSFTLSFNQPPFLEFTAFQVGSMDRRVDLRAEQPGSVGGPLEGDDARPLSGWVDEDGVEIDGGFDGLQAGVGDRLRGGPDHDVLHGGAGDDLMNGDSGGDVLFGSDGSDVMWGGQGDPAGGDARETGGALTDDLVDYLLGGRGGDPDQHQGVITGGADVLDYRPRPQDPIEWHEMVEHYADPNGDVQEAADQHHHGIDWIYGGWDRDVMQGNVAGQGPNDGDRMIDWTGAYNLYTHCEPDYGGQNDVRSPHPDMFDFLERLAYAWGAGPTLNDVRSSGTSGFAELALVYRPDTRDNSGQAYPDTPGHFTEIACDDS